MDKFQSKKIESHAISILYILRYLQEVDHEGRVSSLRFNDFGDGIGICDLPEDAQDHDLSDVNIKAEREDPDFR